MVRQWFCRWLNSTRVAVVGWSGFLAAFLPAAGQAAVKTWDGGAGDSLWGSPANWNNDTLPTASDDVILNNAGKSGSYLVSISTGVSAVCRTLTVGYPGNPNTITLRIASFSTVVPALTVGGNTAAGVDDFVVDQGGVFTNQSGAVAGSMVVDLNNNASNTARVKSGGMMVHASAVSFESSFPASGAGAITFDQGSTMEFTAGSPLSLTGRQFGHLAFSGGAITAPAATGSLTVFDSLVVRSGASLDLSPHTGNVILGGDLRNDGDATLILAGPPAGVTFNGTSRILSPEAGKAVKFENGFTVASGKTLTIETPEVTISGGQSGVVNGTVAFEAAGSIKQGGGESPHGLTINSGATLRTARPDGLEGVLGAPGTLSFNSGADLVFNASANHFTGATRTPAAVRNLTISNAPGVQTALSANMTVQGSLTVGADCTLAAATWVLNLSGPSHTVNGRLSASAGGGTLNVGPGATLNLQGTLGPLVYGAFNVQGTVNFGTTAPVTGEGSFSVLSGGALSLVHPDGVRVTGNAGQIQTASRTFASGSSYTYAGAEPQETGDALPPEVALLNISNGAGVTLSQPVTVTGQLALTSGLLHTGPHLLALGTSAASPGTLSPVAGGVVGTLKRFIPAAASATLFPLSDGTASRAVTADYAPEAPSGGSLTARFTQGDPGGWPLSLQDGTVELVNVAREGCWTLTPGDGLTGGVFDLALEVDGFEALGNTDTLRIVRRATDSDPWNLAGVAGVNSATTVRATGLTGFSEFAVAGGSDQVPVRVSGWRLE